MASFWDTLRRSAREAAAEYRSLAEQHRQELSAARQALRGEHRDNLADIEQAIRRAALYDDTDAMHAEMEAALRESLLRAHPTTDSPRAQAVLDRLHAARPGAPALSVLVLDSAAPQAFVGFGDTVYLTAGMLALLPSDDALAFVIAHEISHIDAGDNRLAASVASGLPVLPETLPLQLGLGLLVRSWMSPQRELAADRGALALARRAGYAPGGFEEVFDALAAVAIEQQLDALVERDLSAWSEFWAQKLTGYPSLRARQARLRAAQGAGASSSSP